MLTSHYRNTIAAHLSQYFSIIVTFSPTSKQASWVAGFSHVMQYRNFFALAVLTKGLRDRKNFLIPVQFLNVLMSAAACDEAIIAAEITKHPGLPSLSLIKRRTPHTLKNVMIMINGSSFQVNSRSMIAYDGRQNYQTDRKDRIRDSRVLGEYRTTVSANLIPF